MFKNLLELVQINDKANFFSGLTTQPLFIQQTFVIGLLHTRQAMSGQVLGKLITGDLEGPN